MGQELVVKEVPKFGATAVPTVEVAVPILPHTSRTEMVYVPGKRFSKTDEFWNGRVMGDGAMSAYWKAPGAPFADNPVAAVADTVKVPVALEAQEGLETVLAVGAVLATMVNVARRILLQASTASTV